uniref:Uncharacterized protein n=1 Tax=Anopheles arabiensis TaxID=7173 RepID=A0A182I387_ANOAR
MELASQLFTELTIQSYHEQALSLTPRLAIETLELQSAPTLKHLTILPNPHLRSLYIVNSAVRRIPDTIVNLRNLQFLGIEKSFLRLLDLSVMCYLPRLATLQVLRNHISLLLPVHESSCVNSLRDLHLDYNQLTTLDIAVLAPFTLGPGNNFTWIEFEQLDLPETLTANLPGNQFQQLPTIRNANLPNLQRIYLDGNQLSTIDLAQLQEHQQLNGIDFSRNRLRTVTASELIHLPNLTSIELVDNMLELFSLVNCSFPQLNYLYLKGNRLQFVPAEVYMSELSPTFMLNLEKNPLRSDNLSIEILYLDNNPLQYLDFNSLRQLQRLTTLSIRECNLQRLYSSAPVTLPALGSIEAIQNNLTLFDLLLLDAPSLKTLLLSKNRIHKQPWDLTKYTQLQVLDLDYNRLTTFDLAGLAGLNELQSLYVSFNQLETFTASRKVRLPSLKTLVLISNSLRSLPTYDRWYLPAISVITLVNNLFTAVPLLYSKRWPTVTLRMTNNPLACSSLQ